MWNSRTMAGTLTASWAEWKTGASARNATGSARPASTSTTARRSETSASGSYVALSSRTRPVT